MQEFADRTRPVWGRGGPWLPLLLPASGVQPGGQGTAGSKPPRPVQYWRGPRCLLPCGLAPLPEGVRTGSFLPAPPQLAGGRAAARAAPAARRPLPAETATGRAVGGGRAQAGRRSLSRNKRREPVPGGAVAQAPPQPPPAPLPPALSRARWRPPRHYARTAV